MPSFSFNVNDGARELLALTRPKRQAPSFHQAYFSSHRAPVLASRETSKLRRLLRPSICDSSPFLRELHSCEEAAGQVRGYDRGLGMRSAAQPALDLLHTDS